jgi:hypothetical protein
MRIRSWLVATFVAAHAFSPPAEAQSASDPAAAARADLDTLYKGDYRRAFVEKNPELFGRHLSPDLRYSSYDGSSASADELKGIVAGRIASIERVLEHNVTIEHVEVADDGRITAVVTLTTVLDVRSSAGKPYQEVSVGTYRDAFVKRPDGTLLEVQAELMRSHTLVANRP